MVYVNAEPLQTLELIDATGEVWVKSFQGDLSVSKVKSYVKEFNSSLIKKSDSVPIVAARTVLCPQGHAEQLIVEVKADHICVEVVRGPRVSVRA